MPGRKRKISQEGPFEIEKCQTISKSGSYKLVRNLTFTASTAICLTISASSVTIDLAGFTITGPGPIAPGPARIAAGSDTTGIAVRNGSISNFGFGISLAGSASIVEGLRVVGTETSFVGIAATGIVKGNSVSDILGVPGQGVGISATGIVSGNYVNRSRITGIQIGQGSTVIGNTAVNGTGSIGEFSVGLSVDCPSNVTDNTAVDNAGGNLVLNGTGCNNTNNVAP